MTALPPAALRRPPKWAANFPGSTARPSGIFHFLGITPASTATVRRVVEENDRGYDMYEEQRRYAHNHFSHAALARYALGASPALIQADWEHDRKFLASLDPKDGGRERDVEGFPDKFDRSNWSDPRWFGKKGSYSRYLPFFHEEVKRLGIKGALQEYIFSGSANVGAGNGPNMLVCLFAGLVHPFIHIGYGLEFNDPVIVAEGLSQACLHSLDTAIALYPQGWPSTPLPSPRGPSKPFLRLYLDFCNNPNLYPGDYNPDKVINDRLREALTPPHVADVQDLVARWDLSDMSDAGVAERFHEIAWIVTLLTGATSRPGYSMRIDFFLMHMLTSSLFIPSYMPYLDETQRRHLLQSYALTIFQLLIVRGRPHIFPKEVMSYPDQPDSGAKLAKDGHLEALGNPADPAEQNPWLEIVGQALAFRESHVPKSIRSLVHFAIKYGYTPKGGVPGALANGKEIIPGIGDVDGSLFVRVAGKIMETQGWIKSGAKEADWDRSALGWDGAWGKPKAEGRWGGGTND